jgi:hypothetical protein
MRSQQIMRPMGTACAGARTSNADSGLKPSTDYQLARNSLATG